jgi:hypothetical protein
MVIVRAKEPVFDDFVPLREANAHDADVEGVDKGGMDHDTVFTVTLMMAGPPNAEDEIFVPSRENVESETEENKLQEEISETNINNGRVISLDQTNQNAESKFLENKPEILGTSEVISTLKWKRRAERAERLVIDLVDENHRRKTRRVTREGQRPDLKETLGVLTDNDPPLDKMVGVEFMVIRRLNKSTNWFSVDFVDGDEDDDYEWCEGPFHTQTTIRELWGRKYRYDRAIRRRITGQKKVPYGESSSDSERDNEEDYSSSSDDDGGNDGENRSKSDDSEDFGKSKETSDDDSDETEDYEQQESLSVVDAPKFDLLPGQGYRSGSSRSVGFASFMKDASFEVVKDLSPGCGKPYPRTPDQVK